MEIQKLSVEHYDQLLHLLNYTFGNKYGREMDFLSEQPKMWVRDEEHMARHLGAFEDGKLCAVVGVYPLPTVIDGTPFLFATTGNVATLPEYEGRGYFTALFTEAMRELDRMGADAARLGGARQRYGRFGYEGCGVSYLFSFGESNRVRVFGASAGADIVFAPVEADDTDALAFCRALSMKRSIYVERSPEHAMRDVYLSMCSKNMRPFLATRGGRPVGYLCASANGHDIGEICAVDTAALCDIICGWQARCNSSVSFALPPYMTDAVRVFCASAESFRVTYPSRFRILNWQKLVNVLMGLAVKLAPQADGEWVTEITGYGKLKLFVRGEKAGCERTDEPPDLTLDPLAASRLLLGPSAPYSVAELPPIPRSWFPLPMSWGALDSI